LTATIIASDLDEGNVTADALVVLESLGVAAVAVDRHGAITAWTAEFRALIPHPLDQLRGLRLWELASPNDRDGLRQALLDTATDRHPRRVDAVMAAGAGQRRMAWSCSFVPHGGDDSIVAWGIDIVATAPSPLAADAGELPGEVAARERKLSAIYENVPGIVFYVAVEPDGDFRFLSMSHAGVVATGLSRERFAGSLVRNVIPPPSRDLVLNHYREAIRSGQTVRWKEVSVYPAGRRVGEVAVTPLYDATGAATHLVGIVHDITEREHLEEALHQREERMAFLLRLNDALRPLSNPVEIQEVTVRLLGEHLRVNRVAYSVIDGEAFIVTTSFDHGVAPIRGRWPISAFGGGLLEAYRRGETVTARDVRTDARFTDAERANLSTHGIVAFLRVMLHKEGRWVATFGINSATPRDWTHDEIVLIEETAERMWSAAERARAEAALREREQRLRLALEASAAGSWTWDAHTNHVDWDEGFRLRYGFAPDEPATYEAWLGRVHEQDRAQVFGLLNEVLHSTREAWDNTFRIVRPDGTVSWIQSLGRAERDTAGEVTRLTGLELDVTARRHAEEALQARRDEEHDRELRLLLETAAQGIVSMDVHGVIVMANRAMESMFGWRPGELIGQPIERLVPSSVPDAGVEQLSAFLASAGAGQMGADVGLVGQRKDGSTFPIEVSLNHVATAGGGRAIAFVTDITERQRAAAALRERTVELEYRSAQLSRLTSELMRVEQHAREQLAKTLHDGLQQLLLIAALNLDQHVKREAQRGAAPVELLVETRAHLEQAIAAARSLSVELFPPVLQSAGLPAALVWLADWTHSKYGLDVQVSCDPLADSARKDVRTLVFEAVRELLVNAVKHARVERVTVELALDLDDMLRISVSDEGIGFDPAALADRTKAGHVGWGLFSIRERLLLLGGRFEIESAPGRGTRFSLIAPKGEKSDALAAHLDASGVTAEPPTSHLAADSASSRALRILIVDDHAAVRRVFGTLLEERQELRVVGEAADGLEAITQAHALRPDVILMDVSMPRMDGVEATRRLRAELPSIQIFGLSMQLRTDDPTPIEQVGATGFFTKGVDTHRLIDHLLLVHMALSGHPVSGREAVPLQPRGSRL
jgi:PAS domain S-box-containing protein